MPQTPPIEAFLSQLEGLGDSSASNLSNDHILATYGLANFKSFHYLSDTRLKPLTLLAGANSSGKSSIIQSLLLLKQSLQADQFSGPLKFDGEWTRLSSYRTVASGFRQTAHLQFRFGLTFDAEPDLLRTMLPDSINLEKNARIASYVCFEFRHDPKKQEVQLNRFKVQSGVPSHQSPKQFTQFEIGPGGTKLRIKNAPPLPPLPNGRRPRPDGAVLDRFWPSALAFRPQHDTGKGEQESGLYMLPLEFISLLSIPLGALRHELTDNLLYIGPLRDRPIPFYQFDSDPFVAPTGRGTIPYLMQHAQDEVQFYKDPCVNELSKARLIDAVQYWLTRMDVTSDFAVNDIRAVGFWASLASPSARGKKVNLAQVGFGVSQLLPILVAGLMKPRNAMLLLEQPEIHLHPRLQAILAEFLLCVGLSGKRVLVETHSDHFIHRMRRMATEDRHERIARSMEILFVHKGTPENPSSYVETLELDNKGNIKNWPPDFLAETANESLAIMRARRGKGSDTEK